MMSKPKNSPKISNIRLSEKEIEVIKAQVPKVVCQPWEIFLFGSRTNLEVKGGDVDLMIELQGDCENPVVLRSKLSALMSIALEGMKVDLVVKAHNTKILPIHEVALEEGVKL